MQDLNESETTATAEANDPPFDQAPPTDLPPSTPEILAPARRDADERTSRSSRRGSRSRPDSRRGDHTERLNASDINRNKRRHQLWAARLIAVVAIVVGVVLSMMLIQARSRLATRSIENGTLASELNRAQGELIQTKQLVAAQEVELGALLKQRIPGVTSLEVEKLYEINQKQIKKLSFTETGVGTEKRLAYYAVLKNSDAVPVVPAVTILLFDRKGLQTGVARVKREAATTPAEHEELLPGESRTYSAAIEMIRDDAPLYFLVETR